MKSNESGFSLLGVMIALGMVAILAVLASRITGQSKEVLRTINHESHIMDLKHYLKSNFSCEITKKKYGGSCPSTLTPIDAYRHDEELLADAGGTEFYKFNIQASCEGDDFHFFYSDSEVSNQDIFNGIPISCADIANSNLQVLVNDRWRGICCPVDGAPPVLTNNSCVWDAPPTRELLDLDSGLYLDCPQTDLSGSFAPVDCTCRASAGETYHGVGGHVWTSINLPNGAPIFPNNGAPTCLHVKSDGSMSTIYSIDGATSTPPPINKAAAWDGNTWLPHPGGCNHFRLLSP